MTEQEARATRAQRAVGLAEVPPEKWPAMVQRTVLGLGFIALGIVGAKLWAWPWYVAIGCTVFGATMWSGQLVTGTLKALLGPVKAYRRAVKGEGTDEGDPDA